MIIIRLTSGLGNQLFQYATARNIAYKHNTILKIDKISYYSDDFRSCELFNYKINAYEIKTTDLLKLKPLQGYFLLFVKFFAGRIRAARLYLKFESKWLNYYAHYNTKFSQLNPLIKKRILIQRYYHYDDEILKTPDNIYLIGYFQSWKYFNDIRSILIKELQPKFPIIGKNNEILTTIRDCNSVSIHIRRGDYFTNKENRELFEVYNLEYFQKAIQLIKTKINNIQLFLFSDDINWVKNNFKVDEEIYYIEKQDERQTIIDLYLMSNCKHNIISNSSFSWWGAWLNNNPEKIVIAPKKWLNSDDYNIKDLLPPNWIRI